MTAMLLGIIALLVFALVCAICRISEVERQREFVRKQRNDAIDERDRLKACHYLVPRPPGIRITEVRR